jgi:hypothetical protein
MIYRQTNGFAIAEMRVWVRDADIYGRINMEMGKTGGLVRLISTRSASVRISDLPALSN